MLIIKAPIELRCSEPLVSVSESFGERMIANYEMINTQISGQDLLHLVTQPPDVYLAEEGSLTNVVSQTNITNTQENKIEVLNNFLNRILVTEEANLTYQDRVYISSILRKLGIRNEHKFMQQVFRLREENNQVNQLINLYWEHIEDLQSLVQEYMEHTDQISQTQEVTLEQEQINHLHDTIFNRLQTGAIYQTVSNFYHRQYGINEISNQELLLADQTRTVQNILLQKLQNEARGEHMPLVFYHENVFEEQDESEEEQIGGKGREKAESQLTAAVLLNLIDNLYVSRQEERNYYGDTWLRTGRSYYQSAENTLQRIRNNMHVTRQQVQQISQNSQTVNLARKEEISLIEQLVAHNQVRQEMHENRLLTQEYIQNMHSTDVTLQQLEQKTQEQLTEEITEQITQQNRQTTEEQNLYATENLQQLNEYLDQINQQNIENYQQMQVRLQEQEQQREKDAPRRGQTLERMKRDSLQALENPEQLLMTLREEGEAEPAPETPQSRLLEAAPQETRELFRMIEEYIQAPELVRAKDGVSKDNLGQLILDSGKAGELFYPEQEQQLREAATEQLSEVVENQIREQEKHIVNVREHTSTQAEHLSFVHKTVQTSVDEELIEEMRTESRAIQQTTRETIENIVNRNTSEVRNVTQHHQVITQNTQDVTEIVQQNLRNQIGAISEQVYSKLERKLDNERRRRGR